MVWDDHLVSRLIVVGRCKCDQPVFRPVARKVGTLAKEVCGAQRSILSNQGVRV